MTRVSVRHVVRPHVTSLSGRCDPAARKFPVDIDRRWVAVMR